MSLVQNPSYTAVVVTGAYDVVSNKGRHAHGFRAKGTGTVTITTAASDSVVCDVNDGEFVPIQFSAITALSGVTSVRIHLPKPYGKAGVYGGGS